MKGNWLYKLTFYSPSKLRLITRCSRNFIISAITSPDVLALWYICLLPFWPCILFPVGLKRLQLHGTLCELILLHTFLGLFLLIMVQSEKCQHRSLTCLCSKCMGISANRSCVGDSLTVSENSQASLHIHDILLCLS